jgi:cytochrome oxidase Cu insertion factor (SCO1/SenC/PrrC family)
MAPNLGTIASGALLLAITGLGAMQWLGGAPAPSALLDPAATVGGPFRLTDEAGGRVTETTWRGRFVLLDFGYRYCPYVCPTELAKMVEAYELLAASAQAQLVLAFATADPERDDAAALTDTAGAASATPSAHRPGAASGCSSASGWNATTATAAFCSATT